MKLAFYDIESTGMGKTDEVIQFAAIVTDIDLNVQNVISTFCFSNRPIHPDAYKVHGIDQEMLLRESKGRYFEQFVESEPLFRKEKNVTFIAYNDSFDRRIINQTLTNNGYRPINFGTKVDFIEYGKTTGRYNYDAIRFVQGNVSGGERRPLTHVAKTRCSMPWEKMLEVYKLFVSKAKLSVPVRGAHDALFDSFIMWWIMSENKAKVYI